MNKRYYPCPYCKGDPIEYEYVDGQEVALLSACNYCEEQGMIEIGGEVHMRHKRERVGMEALMAFGGEEWYVGASFMHDLGTQVEALVKSLPLEAKSDPLQARKETE